MNNFCLVHIFRQCRLPLQTRTKVTLVHRSAAAATTLVSPSAEEKEGKPADIAIDTNTQSWEPTRSITLSRLPSIYARLSKLKLSGLVVLTTMGGYALAPMSSMDWLGLGVVSLGTAFCVASANSFNQWIEIPYDAQMKRTCDRPLVRGDISPFHAFSVAVTSGVIGFGILSTINPLVAFLGLGNIFLYAGVYTPMKRHSIANTWVGSIVGAIPPLMGWAAATGSLSPPAFVLAGVLFAWQFPHFNALSWKLRPDYSKAGYRMMSVIDPALCKAVALRYSAALIPISLCAPALGLTDWTFAVDSTLINGYITYKAYQFYKQGDDTTARKLFLTSLWHLPAIMGLLLVHHHFA
eukprot:m.242363 g.242363  ORF g.242363 m.242363 type:complete len:352 (+) comp17135_c3_seq1:115-1170(+)